MKQVRFAVAASMAAFTLFLSGIAHAQSAAGSTGAAAASSSEMTDGEIRKVDKENNKLTIKHGPLKHLDMPGMTMVFQVQNPSLLETVQPGEKIRFMADKIDGKFTVTHMEVVP